MAITQASRAGALALQFQSAFSALSELSRTSPAEAAQIAEAVASHLRSAMPMATGADPIRAIVQRWHDGGYAAEYVATGADEAMTDIARVMGIVASAEGIGT